jgi:hypothetical protein
MAAIDQRRWGDLRSFLSSGFTCEYVRTGECFGLDEWVRLNAE